MIDSKTDHYVIDEPPSQFRLVATLLGVVLLAAFNTTLLDLLFQKLPDSNRTGWNASTDSLM
ncbi:MAG TPA: hypothetical protein VKX17_14250, partial [Planctomycetota bacterium]|nr:hypothetical protein [Planctomycetota bacterium]